MQSKLQFVSIDIAINRISLEHNEHGKGENEIHVRRLVLKLYKPFISRGGVARNYFFGRQVAGSQGVLLRGKSYGPGIALSEHEAKLAQSKTRTSLQNNALERRKLPANNHSARSCWRSQNKAHAYEENSSPAVNRQSGFRRENS